MQIVLAILAVALAYVIGSIPVGCWWSRSQPERTSAKWKVGAQAAPMPCALRVLGGLRNRHARYCERCGRCVGGKILTPGTPIIHMIAPLAAILGHNHSIFLPGT
ncbi:MAG: hypothetical protein IPP55_16990 [Anaerolineales bacterium]|nr:hypothetical protein [Anaerolineales bacterium]